MQSCRANDFDYEEVEPGKSCCNCNALATARIALVALVPLQNHTVAQPDMDETTLSF